MTDQEEQLQALGLDREQITAVIDMMERDNLKLALSQAGQILHLIFLRLERDSAAGCALRRALGFSGGESLARAAKAFGISKQYLHTVQVELEQALGEELSFVARQARAVTAAGDSETHPAPGNAGPSGDED